MRTARSAPPYPGLVAGDGYCVSLVATQGQDSSDAPQVAFTAGVPGAETDAVTPTGAGTATLARRRRPRRSDDDLRRRVRPRELSVVHQRRRRRHGEPVDGGADPRLRRRESEGVSIGLSGLTPGAQYCAALAAGNGSGSVTGDQFTLLGRCRTIDPTTQAESGVLLVFGQLAGGLVFLGLGLDREVIRTLAYSLEAHPAGAWMTRPAAEAMLRLGGDMLALAVRLALPAIALLVLVDLALGLMGRLNAQLHLMTLAFPIKMTVALVLLGWIAMLVPRLMGAYGGVVFGTLRRALRF